ncbi:RICIN domain-containing protein [Dactylosporangium sp. NPDC005555]|uniref:RICIN domain-containing protein n=1 Tax=Dactylosporangium sp. NPDC005555 TaxID=3154889 RepID=UPI0033B83EEF
MSRRLLIGLGIFVATAVAVPVITAVTTQTASAVAGRNLPPNGKVMFLAGQTTPDLTAYKQQVLDVDASFPRPGGVTLYTNISPNACNGLTATCNLNGNIFNFNQTLSEYPGAALAVGLYLADNPGCQNQPLRAIIGRQDADIAGALGAQYRQNLDNLIVYLRNTNRAVYLRVGYEFDGPWNCYNYDFYKAAFRVVKQRIDALGATNVATVWQSASYAKDGDAQYKFDFSNANHLADWYPGDDVVDWVALSTFYWDANYRQYQWACDNPTSSPKVLYDRVLNFARSHNKPAMISESTPQAYRTAQLDASCTNVNNRVSLGGDWSKLGTWYNEYFNYINTNADVLRGAAYINSNWEAIAQFACPPGASSGQPGCSDGYWGNSRIQDNASIQAGFKRELQNSLFVNGTLTGRGANWGGTQPPAARTIVGVGSNRCLDVSGGRTTDGAVVQLWDCLNNGAQQWRQEGNALVNPQSGKCLDIDRALTANGTKVQLWTCYGNTAQQWVIRADGSIYNPPSGRCLDASGRGTANGTPMIIWDCLGLPNQLWTVR